MRKNLVNGDGPFPVNPELRAVVGDGIHQVDQALFRQHVHKQCRHRLGGGEVADRSISRHRNLGGVARVMGAIATGMANRPVQNLLTLVADGNLDTRVHAGPVKALDAAPQGINRFLTDTGSCRIFTGIIPKGDGFEILGNLTAMEGTAGKSVHRLKPFSVRLLFFYVQQNRPGPHWPGRSKADVTSSTCQDTSLTTDYGPGRAGAPWRHSCGPCPLPDTWLCRRRRRVSKQSARDPGRPQRPR